MATKRELARDLAGAFVSQTRRDGDEFLTLREGAPDWMRAVVQSAHGEFLPDDTRYQMIADTVELLGRGSV